MDDRYKIILLTVILAALSLLIVVPGLTAANYEFFLWQRVPKLAAILITGGAIAFSAVVFQTMTHNRILTPATLGFDALYLFIQVGVFFFLGAGSFLVVDRHANFLFAVAIMAGLSILLLKLVFEKGSGDLIFIVLVGTIFGQLFRTLAYFLLMIISPSEFTSLQNKMFASFSNINTPIVLLAGVICILAGVFLLRDVRRFDVATLGRDQSTSLGVGHESLVRRTFIVSAVMVSAATALVGPIAFLGLMVANLARQISNTYRHAVLIPIAVLLSAVMLAAGQLVVERYLNFGTTVTVIINFVGGVYFVVLLLRENKL